MPIYIYIYIIKHLRQVNVVKKKKPKLFGVMNTCVNNAKYTGMCLSLDDWRL